MSVLASDLLSDEHTNHVINDFSGKKTILYYIHNTPGLIYTEAISGGKDYSYRHSLGAERFIQNIFDTIDSHIDLDFQRTFSEEEGNIDIYYLGLFTEGVLGLTYSNNPYDGDVDIFWERLNKYSFLNGDYENLKDYDAYALIHEIGHSLGLDHPNNDPYGDWHDSEDTIMSYNFQYDINLAYVDPPRWSSVDIQALQSIWGVEKDNSFNIIEFSNQSDRIIGTELVDHIYAFAGDDLISGGKSNDIIDGGDGNDIAIYTGKFSDYLVSRDSNYLQLSDVRTGVYDGTDKIKNVEYIQFSDQLVKESKVDVVKTFNNAFNEYIFVQGNRHNFYTDGLVNVMTRNYFFQNRGLRLCGLSVPSTCQLSDESVIDSITGFPKLIFSDKTDGISAIVDIKSTFDQVTGLNTDSGKIFRLYNSAFRRLPDPIGLKYWIDNFSLGIDDERAISTSFILSNEFTELYGENISDSKFVNSLYQNVFGRGPDKDGEIYWLNQLSTGVETRNEVLLGFSESYENRLLFTEITGLI